MVVWLVIVLLVAGLAAVVITPDITNYRDFDIPRYASSASIGDRAFVLYQDYRTLHASITMVEFGPGNRTGSQKVLVSGLFDCVRPKAFPYDGGLMVSWLEMYDKFERFCYARYDIGTGRLGSIARLDVQATASGSDHSFDGRNFTLATMGAKSIKLMRLDTEFQREYKTTLELNGTPACLDQNGSRTYFGINEGRSFTLYFADWDRVVPAGTGRGELWEVRGRDDCLAFLVKTVGEGWGEVGFSNGNRTVTGELKEIAYGMVMLPRPNGMFLAWSENMENPSDDEEENYEVKLAFVFNLSAPAMEEVRTVSEPDGQFSTNAAIVGTAYGGRLFWLDGSEGYSMWTAGFTDTGVGEPSPMISNGAGLEDLSFVASMVVGMGTIFGMMGLLLRGKKKTSRTVSGSTAFRPAEVAPGDAHTKAGGKDTYFIDYKRPELYLSLRFFLPGLAFTAVFLLMGFKMATGNGSGFGFRVGYENILMLAITAILSMAALMLLWSESGVSAAHRAGYAMLAIATIVALSGLLFYQSARAAFNPDALPVIRAATVASFSLAMMGPSVMLYGLSRNSGFLVPVISYGTVLLFLLLDIGHFQAAAIFPSIASPSTIVQEGSGFLLIMLNIMVAMVFGIFLFKELKLSDIKGLKQWTRNEVAYERNRALLLSLLVLSPMVAISGIMLLGAPDPFAGSATGGWAMGFVFVLVLVVVVLFMTRFQTNRERFNDSFKTNPSGTIYSAYCWPAMYSIVVMIATLFWGAAGFLVLLFYADGIRRAEKAVQALPLEEIKADAKDE